MVKIKRPVAVLPIGTVVFLPHRAASYSYVYVVVRTYTQRKCLWNGRWIKGQKGLKFYPEGDTWYVCHRINAETGRLFKCPDSRCRGALGCCCITGSVVKPGEIEVVDAATLKVFTDEDPFIIKKDFLKACQSDKVRELRVPVPGIAGL